MACLKAKLQCILNSRCNAPLQIQEAQSFISQNEKTLGQHFVYDNGLVWNVRFFAAYETFQVYLYYIHGLIHLGVCGGLDLETIEFNDEYFWLKNC